MGDDDSVVTPGMTLAGKLLIGLFTIAGVVIAIATLVLSGDFERNFAPAQEQRISTSRDSDQLIDRLIDVKSPPENAGPSLAGAKLNLDIAVERGAGVADYKPVQARRMPSLTFDTTHCPNAQGQSTKFNIFVYGEQLGPDNFGMGDNGEIVLKGFFEVDKLQQVHDAEGNWFCFIDIHEKADD